MLYFVCRLEKIPAIKYFSKFSILKIVIYLFYRVKLKLRGRKNTMFHEKTFCLITGASKGFGRSVAVALARRCTFGEGSVLVLTGRSGNDLLETKRLIEELNKALVVQIVIADLENLESLDDFLSEALPQRKTDFVMTLLVNNAGSLGNIVSSMKTITEVADIQKYFNLNLTSVFWLTTRFLSHFSSSKNTVVNISSLAAIQEMPFMSLYCTGKAARDMMHKCLACEEDSTRVLNYAPGPLDTDMSMDIQVNCGNESSRNFFKELREKNTIIKPDASADKLMKILIEDSFKSGEHIDFYDIE